MEPRNGQGFTVVTTPNTNIGKLVVVDLDDPADGGPRVCDREICMLSALAERATLAVATSYSAREALEELARSGMPGKLLSRMAVIELEAGDDGRRAAGPVDRLAQLCSLYSSTFAATTVIAATPSDYPLALEAGTVYALLGAGGTNQLIASRLFPARKDGGLVRALEALRTSMGANGQREGGFSN